MQDSSFHNQLCDKASLVNNTLRALLDKQPIMGDLREALIYVLESPGKRIRSALVLWCCEIVSPPKAEIHPVRKENRFSNGVNRNAEIAAAAMEMVHTYSLVHDDLPAMDNDDLRRGLPTCHKQFDEATAILAGDALLTLAFEILAKEIDNPAIAVKLIAELAEAAGPSGMIAGQLADLKAVMTDSSEEFLQYIHINKTAKMFRAACAMGAICGGANQSQFDCLCEYGLNIGLGFQIADDILDVCATSQQLGKTAGKDAKAKKATYPAIVGLARSRQLAEQLANQANAALQSFGPKADTLRQLATALLERTR
jgi:geranylgeranyl diphosphate synthase type II